MKIQMNNFEKSSLEVPPSLDDISSKKWIFRFQATGLLVITILDCALALSVVADSPWTRGFPSLVIQVLYLSPLIVLPIIGSVFSKVHWIHYMNSTISRTEDEKFRNAMAMFSSDRCSSLSAYLRRVAAQGRTLTRRELSLLNEKISTFERTI